MPESVQQIEQLVHEGKFLEARNRAERLIGENGSVRLKQLLALSMAKSGSPKAAMDFLEPVYRQFPDDPETSGILGSIYKELFKETKNTKYAVLSRDTYLANFKLTKNYYTGINAASMSAISGSLSKAREIAKEIIANLKNETSDPWHLATLGEAHLLIQEKTKAMDLYLKCRQLIGSDWGKVNSIYNQLWLLNHYVSVSNQILNTFSPPSIAAFVGHMIDHPSRQLQRFPASIENDVKEAIRGALKSINARIGYCSMACGGDILFAESIVESGGELNLFLPFDTKDFIHTSVEFAGDQWVERFGKLMSQHRVHHVTKESYAGNDDLFALQARVIFGSAIHRSQMLHSDPHLISVFADTDSKPKEGGTRDTIKVWPTQAKRININPLVFLKESAGKTAVTNPQARILRDENRHARFLISASIDNLTDEERERWNYQLRKKLEEFPTEEVQVMTDGVVCAYATSNTCVSLAWSILKTQAIPMTRMRITLHAGPVIIGDGNTFSGKIIQQIECIRQYSPTGKVFATFPFSSALVLETDKFAIEYAGIIGTSEDNRIEVFQVNKHSEAFDL